MVGIYKIISPSGKVYIGQAIDIDNRKKDYSLFLWRCKKQPKLFNSLNKYGWEAHKHEIIEECLLSNLDERETFHKIQFIELYGWNLALFCELYDRGGGPKSEITKQKISNSNKGKIVSFKTREKKKMSMLGKKHTKKTKTKMSKASLGKAKSKQHIKNMMENRQVVIDGVKKANSKPIEQFDLKGKFIKEWSSITEAKKIHKSDIQGMLSGRQKTAGGFIWKFKK